VNQHSDWGSALEIGGESFAPEIQHIQYNDCDIIQSTHVAMRINHADRAKASDVRYENIRAESDGTNPRSRLQKAIGEMYPGNGLVRSAPVRAADSRHGGREHAGPDCQMELRVGR
jgi:hypothetical protein